MLVEYLTWIARLTLSAVFAGAAWGKLTARSDARRALAEFGVPRRYVAAAAWALPIVEAAVAVALLPAASAVWGACLGAALLVAFSAAVGRLLLRGRHPPCACFGSAGSKPIGASTLARNAVLLAVAAVAVVGSLAGDAVPDSLPADHAVGLAVMVGLVAVQVRQQLVLTELAKRPAPGPEPTRGLPVGSIAPEFTVTGLDGTPRTLADLVAGGRPVVLVFIHNGCQPCREVAKELPRWRQRRSPHLDIVVIASGSPTENTGWADDYGIDGVLTQKTYEVAALYQVRGIPSAVFIDKSGRVGAPAAAGPDAIKELLVSASASRSSKNVDDP